MPRQLLSCFFVFLFLGSTSAQTLDTVAVHDEHTDIDLVKNIFLKGFCQNVSNISSIGDPKSVGFFHNAGDAIGVEAGIILSTGDIKNAVGPNSSTRITEPYNILGDKDLELISTSTIFDAGGISFSFVPLAEKVSFRYVFASDEYCEFVGSEFNDVFGFFVSGPGINGTFSNNAINVAKIPGSEKPVSINNINHEVNSELYIRNEGYDRDKSCTHNADPQFLANIEFDGFTVPMVAEFDVIPCETYTIRLVVGDVQDKIIDSAVFLEMNSFDIGGNIKVLASTDKDDLTNPSETCNDGILKFERVSDSNIAQTVAYNILPNSDATPGEDFAMLPETLEFDIGQSYIELPLGIITDGEEEPTEMFGIEIDYPCDCVGAENAVFLIEDDIEFDISLDEASVCKDQEFELGPQINGGTQPYTFLWSNGMTQDTINTSIFNDTDFFLSAIDECGRIATANAMVTVKETPEASIGGVYEICEGFEDEIKLDLEGKGPWNISYQVDSDVPTSVENILESPFYIPADRPGNYTLTEFEDQICVGLTSGTAIVEQIDIQVQENITLPTCRFSTDGEISLNIISKYPINDIVWSRNNESDYYLSEVAEGEYTLHLYDDKGCQYEKYFEIESIELNQKLCDNLNVYIPNVYSPNGDGNNDEFLVYLDNDDAIVEIKNFSIFDRWGGKVFEKLDFPPDVHNLGFDISTMAQEGRTYEHAMRPTVLSYVMTALMENGSYKSISGDITIVR